jgi:hypothetical protein
LRHVKKFVVVFLLGVFALTSTELIELTKLPSLVGHFTEHRAENQSLSLFQFIKLHYSDESHHHDENDKRLPFKSHDHCVNSAITYILTRTFPTVELKPDFEAIREFTIPKGVFLTSINPSSIWQPPKSC